MKLSTLMTKELRTVHPETPLREAADLMGCHEVGMLPVVNEDASVAGTVTDRDIVVRAVAKGLDPEESSVAMVMTNQGVVCCYEDDAVEKAAELMQEKRIRRILVLDGEKKLRGVVSLGDLAKTKVNGDLVSHTLNKVCQ